MSEDESVQPPGAIARVLGWASAGCGIGIVAASQAFPVFSGSAWLFAGASLVAVGIGLGFAGFVHAGGLTDATPAAPSRSDRAPAYFAALAGIATMALTGAVMAAAAHGASRVASGADEAGGLTGAAGDSTPPGPPPLPRFVMPAGFGAVASDAGRVFRDLRGDALAFYALPAAAASDLDAVRLRRALAVGDVAISEFASARWPAASGRTGKVWSFARVAQGRRQNGLVAVFPCQQATFVAIALTAAATADDGENIARLISIACPRDGDVVPNYETLLAVAQRECARGNTEGCAVKATFETDRTASTRLFALAK